MPNDTYNEATDIPFTQYLMPSGEKRDTWITRPPQVIDAATVLLVLGVKFESEMLSDYQTISLTAEIEVDGDMETLAHEIVVNGPRVPEAVDRLVADAAKALEKLSSSVPE